jgi:hypothetical protein
MIPVITRRELSVSKTVASVTTSLIKSTTHSRKGVWAVRDIFVSPLTLGTLAAWRGPSASGLTNRPSICFMAFADRMIPLSSPRNNRDSWIVFPQPLRLIYTLHYTINNCYTVLLFWTYRQYILPYIYIIMEFTCFKESIQYLSITILQ